MSLTEQSRIVALRYLKAVTDGDVETMDRLQHRDAHWWVLGGGTMSRETFMGLVRSMFATITDRTITVTGMTIEGERVAIELEGEMTLPDRIYRNSYHNLLIVRDGLIVEGKEYMDTLAVAQAFGGGDAIAAA